MTRARGSPKLARMSRPPRRQRIELGGVTAWKLGGPGYLADVYYHLMLIGWPKFFGLAAGLFVGVNLLFGLIYAALPGSIAGARPGSLTDGFFFSVDTLATVGYGAMAPATPLGHSIAALEIMAGLFLTATLTGLVFARFARPRDAILFSRVAVVTPHFGRPALMVRIVTSRPRPLADVRAQMILLEATLTPDGRPFRRFVELPLIRPVNPMMQGAWTVIHEIEEGGALQRVLAECAELRIMITVNGLDTLLAVPTFGGHTYRDADIRIGQRFAEIVSDASGTLEFDLTRLHETEADGA